jgi:shikimate kinase
MSSGKTTVAKALGERWRCDVVDLDEAIALREGKQAWEIIDDEGEHQFRRIETRLLREILEKGEGEVISLGGGTWIQQENRDLIQQYNCLAVWLDVPFDLCWSRIQEAGHRRPLAVNQRQTKELYKLRKKQYSLAHMRIGINAEMTIEQIVDEIDREVKTTRSAEG